MTDVRLGVGGVPFVDVAMASADQLTILGTGSFTSPLHGTGGGTTFFADFSGDAPPRLGQPVASSSEASTHGITTVTLALDEPIVGVIVAINDSPNLARPIVTVQSSESASLATEQWDAITGQIGGLTPGSAYYLDNAAAGTLTQTQPTASGDFLAQIGVALSPTLLRLSTPVVPEEI